MSAQAFILAAGFGTRLRPLTEHRPKPAVPVLGTPMLHYALASAQQAGFDDVVVNAHYLAEQIEALASWPGMSVHVQVEPAILGTGGALRAAAGRVDQVFCVLNGDILHDIDLRRLLNAVPADGAALALRHGPVDRYGRVCADSSGRLVELAGLGSYPGGVPADRDTHFSGIHALDRSVLERLPAGFACIVRQAYAQMVPEGLLRGVVQDGLWLDVGNPQVYLDANLALLRDPSGLSVDPAKTAELFGDGPWAGGVVKQRSWIGRARLDGVEVSSSVVGHGATIAPGSTLSECIVWDGASVPKGDHHRVIFHDGGALAVSA